MLHPGIHCNPFLKAEDGRLTGASPPCLSCLRLHAILLHPGCKYFLRMFYRCIPAASIFHACFTVASRLQAFFTHVLSLHPGCKYFSRMFCCCIPAASIFHACFIVASRLQVLPHCWNMVTAKIQRRHSGKSRGEEAILHAAYQIFHDKGI